MFALIKAVFNNNIGFGTTSYRTRLISLISCRLNRFNWLLAVECSEPSVVSYQAIVGNTSGSATAGPTGTFTRGLEGGDFALEYLKIYFSLFQEIFCNSS